MENNWLNLIHLLKMIMREKMIMIVKPKFNGVYSRNNLPKIKDGAYVINLDEYKSIGTH